ncbi:MAG: hypothetical protein JO025_09235 [Verrucomicrobia bacterium]|nr:hypothetical protein [Verrucomicrobiota bacterium]
MSNPILYVLPECHINEEDVAKLETLQTLAALGAINVLLEGVYFHDTDCRSGNQYGIEDELQYDAAGLIVKHTRRIRDIEGLGKIVWDADTNKKVTDARQAAHKELGELADTKRFKKLGEGKTVRTEIENYIENYPAQSVMKIHEKHLLYKRNHKIANNIRQAVQLVLRDSSKPRVFALSIGAAHVSVTPEMRYFEDFPLRKDLETILGQTINATTEDRTTEIVEVKYGKVSVSEIASKALELSGHLPFWERLQVKLSLRTYLAFKPPPKTPERSPKRT